MLLKQFMIAFLRVGDTGYFKTASEIDRSAIIAMNYMYRVVSH